MKIVLASHNPGKMKEMSAILAAFGVELVLQSDLGMHIEVEETGTTFRENALLKAQAVMKATRMPAISDDSGLMVDALNGAPGVYTARYGGEGLSDTELSAAALCLDRADQPRSPFLQLYRLRVPHRRSADGPGRMRRNHCLCPYGGRWVRL